MIGLLRKHRFFRSHPLRASYDAVVIGGGAHGMATAYYLAKDHGMKNVAVIEQSYIGAGASGRNTTIIRSNYLTPEGTRFYTASVKLYETLSQDLNFNMLFSQHGHLTLAHSDRSVNTMMERAEVNRLLGVDSRVIYPDEIKELEPMLDVSDHPTFPILAALYHPPGGIIRHDAVVWGYAKEADRLGVEIHPYTQVTGITRQNGRVTGIETNRGAISAGTVISCTSGWSSLVGRLAGIEVPITTHILQACVTEPVKPLLRKIIVSGTLHIYISQSDRGEFVMGSEIEPYSGYSNRGTFRFIEDLAMHMVELLPMLGRARILRQWTGLCDVSPDYAPIMGLTETDGFLIDAGWGTYGFKASPIVGKTMAELAATGRTPDLIAPFRLAALLRERARVRARRGRRVSLDDIPAPKENALKSSLEIAQEATLRPIMDIAREIGLEEDEVDLYGKYKAKISLGALDRLAGTARREGRVRVGDHADEGRRGQDDHVGRR